MSAANAHSEGLRQHSILTSDMPWILRQVALDLVASLGGYAVVIKNLGALGALQDVPAHIQLRGYVQVLSAGCVAVCALTSV